MPYKSFVRYGIGLKQDSKMNVNGDTFPKGNIRTGMRIASKKSKKFMKGVKKLYS